MGSPTAPNSMYHENKLVRNDWISKVRWLVIVAIILQRGTSLFEVHVRNYHTNAQGYATHR